MGEWVILSLPAALMGAGVAFLLWLLGRLCKPSRGIFPVLSALAAILTAAYLLLMGGGLWEAAALLLVFLLLNMGVRE